MARERWFPGSLQGRRLRVPLLLCPAFLLLSAPLLAKTVTLAHADNRTSICLIVGDTLVVTLPSPLHSYHWKLLSETAGPLSSEREFAGAAGKGGGQAETFRFNAALPGKTTLILGFQSSDPDAAQRAAETFSVDVAVASGEPASLVLLGTYQGATACADCTSIQTELRLYAKGKNDFTDTLYMSTRTYHGGRKGDQSFTDRGEWSVLRGDAVDPNATVYALNPDHPDEAQYFLLQGGGAALTQLDGQMKPMDAPAIYQLVLKRE